MTPYGKGKEAVVTINTATGEMTFDTSAFINDIPAGDTYEQVFDYEIVDAAGQPATTTVTIVASPPQFVNPQTPPPPPTDSPIDSPSSKPSSAPTPKPTNVPPIAEDNSYARTVDQLEAGGGTIIGQILENDSDPDGELGDLTITSITPNGGTNTPVQPAIGIDYDLTNGVIRINPVSGGIVYTPDPDKVEALGPGSEITDILTYVITDEDGGTDIATVTFTVVGQNDPPVPEDDSETVPEGNDVSDCVL